MNARAVALMARAGLTLSEMCSLGRENVIGEPAVLPGVDTRALSNAEANLLLAAADDDGLEGGCIARLALYMGARQVEIRRLCRADLDVRDGVMHATLTGKGGRKRRVWVPPVLQETLVELERDSLLFPYSPRRLYARIAGWMRAEGIDARPHDLRHTTATWLLNTGASLEEAMEILGHTEVSSHEVYAAAGSGWFLRSWQRYHPLSVLGQPLAHVRVPGSPYGRRMSRGTERVVPLPMDAAAFIWDALPVGDYRSVVRWFYRHSETNPSDVRQGAAVAMAEAGAHPFLISLLLGVTPGHVVDLGLDRRGPKAERARITALQRALGIWPAGPH